MNKLSQIFLAMSCWLELERSGTKARGLRGIREMAGSTMSALAVFLILTVGILAGWVNIPTWLGDGYSYDYFDRKEGDDPEYNYKLGSYMDEPGVVLKLLAVRKGA